MRFFISLALLSSFIVSVSAQDVLIKRNGDELEVKVIEVLIESLKYKKYSNMDGPLYTMSKTDVFMIKYENGDKEMLADFQVSESQSSQARLKSDRSAAYVEFGGKSVIASVQYEVVCINQNNYKLGARIGIGLGKLYSQYRRGINWRYKDLNVPLSITNLIGDGKHLYEGGFGVTFMVTDEKPLENPLVHLSQGYRFRPDDKKYFIAANVNIFLDFSDGEVLLSPGVLYGIKF